MWTDKAVHYSHLFVFGSPMYIMYSIQETSKLHLKSKKCFFLWYIDVVKNYYMWDPTTHEVIINKDIIIAEGK